MYHEGGAFGENCSPGRPVPLFNSHGEKDHITEYWGRNESRAGGLDETPSVPRWRREWAERNAKLCNETREDGYTLDSFDPETRKGANGTLLEVWETGCDSEVHALTDFALGHAWPTTEGLDRAGAPDNVAGCNLTEEYLLDFFTKHALPRAALNTTFWE